MYAAHKLFNYLHLQFYYTVGRSKLKLKWNQEGKKNKQKTQRPNEMHTTENSQYKYATI